MRNGPVGPTLKYEMVCTGFSPTARQPGGSQPPGVIAAGRQTVAARPSKPSFIVK